MPESRLKLRMMIVSSLFAAIIGVLAQVTIPLPLVPITGQTLAIGLAATILGARYGTIINRHLFMHGSDWHTSICSDVWGVR